MQKRRTWLFFVAGLLWTAVPLVAAAQGLVPCDGINCNLCSVGQLMQNIINGLLLSSLLIAVAMFAYAGFLYVTGGGNEPRITAAHKIFTRVLIGFLLAIVAWLVVQTFVSIVFDKSAFVGKNWYELECSKQERLMNTTLSDLLGKVIPGNNAPVVSGGAGTVDTSGSVSNPLFNSRVTVKEGAVVTGLQQGTIDYINEVALNCNCQLVITEGTGGTHVDGQYDHAAGYKLDVRSKGNATLSSWVQSNGVAGTRTNGDPTYTMSNVVWALEDRGTSNEHWDIQVKPI